LSKEIVGSGVSEGGRVWVIVGVYVGATVGAGVCVRVGVVVGDDVNVTVAVHVGGRDFEKVGEAVWDSYVLGEQPTVNETRGIPAIRIFAVIK
jgi:hypothetical protein